MSTDPNKSTGESVLIFHTFRSAGVLLMLASALLFSVLDGLIKLSLVIILFRKRG
jgi:hypothetical protein